MEPGETINQLANVLQIIMIGLTTWVLSTVLKLRDRIQAIEIKVVDVILEQLKRQDGEIKDLRGQLERLKDEAVNR
jgi:hypothetical protein